MSGRLHLLEIIPLFAGLFSLAYAAPVRCIDHLPKTGAGPGILLTANPPFDTMVRCVCPGSTVMLSVTASDKDVYGEPVICDDLAPKLLWNNTADSSHGSGTTFYFYAPMTPGAYTVTCAAEDGGDVYPNPGWDDSDPAVSWTIYVVKAEIKSVTFTSDHGVLNNWDTNFADSAGTVYNPRGWQKNPLINNPITHTQGVRITANATVKVEPMGIGFDLDGDSSVGALVFRTPDQISTGSDQAIEVTSETA